VTDKLYYGDNLRVLREHVAADSIDLVYLDPPFNSNATYNVLFKAPDGHQSQSQIEAFDDTWHWTDSAEDAYWQVLRGSHSDVAKMLEAMRGFLGENDMMAYLAMMAIRLIELHRVLKPTGSLYLHCDPTASHYLKILLDAVFGKDKFRSEVVWKRSSAHSDAKQGRKLHGHIHDVILFYTKGKEWFWNDVFTPYDEAYIERDYSLLDENGRRFRRGDLTAAKPGGDVQYDWRVKKRSGAKERWVADLEQEHLSPVPGWDYLAVRPYSGRYWAYSKANMRTFAQEGRLRHTFDGMPEYKRFLDEMPGVPLQDLWTDIHPIIAGTDERLGYPTQKPVALLERIISASSNPGDLVLDPFCGCGTTIHAAQKLGRRWIGIDVTPLAIRLIQNRLRDAFGKAAKFEIIGLPQDHDGAQALFDQDPHAFQLWAVSLIPDAQNWKGGKKGADTGVDGQVYLRTGKSESHRAMISVKGGKNVGVAMVRDFAHVVDREMALLGLFLTLTPPTRDMETEAVKAGYVETDQGRFRKLQILTIDELLNGKRPEMPFIDSTAFKRARREDSGGTQGEMEL